MPTANETYKGAASSAAGHQAAETAKSIGEEVGDFAGDIGRMASKQYGRVQDTAVDALDDAHALIKGNPLIAIAIALGIGFILGVVAGSRR